MKRLSSFLFLAFSALCCVPMGAKGETTVVLTEDFSSITAGNSTGTSGSSSSWTGNDNFPTVSAAYKAGGAVKVGKSGEPGSITSKELDLRGDSVTVTFDVKGWSSVEGNITVSLASGPSSTVTYTAVMSGDFESKTVTFNASGAAADTVTIASTAKRAFIDNVEVSVTAPDVVLGNATKNSFSVSFTPETWAEEYTLSIISRGYDTDTLIEEAWDKVTSASQSAITADQYNNATYTQVPGWSGERAYRYYAEGYESGGAVRIGNTSTAGYIQTPAFENLALGTTLKVSCKALTSDNKTTLRISTRRANGSERDAREFYSESKETELDLTGENAVLLTAGAGDRVMFQVVSPNKSQRIVIDDIVVEEIPMDARQVTVSGSPYTVENALPGRRYVVSVVATDGTHSSGPATADIVLPKAKVGTALTIF